MDTIEKKISLKKRVLTFFAAVAVLAGGVVAGVQADDKGKLIITSDQPGAQLQILDASGNVVIDGIVTTGAPQEFRLPAGEGYKLHEVKAPEGYKPSTGDWTFSIVPEYQETTQVISPAKQLPGSVSAYNDGLPTTGAYHTNTGMFVFCVDASDEFPPRGNYSAQDFNGFNGLSRDQLLRILYVGFVGNAKNYGSQFVAAEDYDAGTQFWMATQYAVTSYTNPSLAEEYFGKYLGSNKRLANQIKAAANDTSIVVPEGSIAYLYQSAGNQPFAAASFPVVQQVQIHGQAMEISLTHEQSTTPPPPPSSENGKVVIKKTDDNGNVLQGAKFQIKNQNGQVVREFTSTGNDEFTLAPGTYVLQEVEAPNGYQIKGDGKYTFTIKPGTAGVVTPGQTATVTAAGTTGGSIFVGTGHMEVAGGLVFCVNPQAVFLWEGNGGNTYSYKVLGESDVDLNAFGTKNSAGARGWMNAAPGNVGLNAAKMDQVKKVLWATYDYALTGDANKDYTGVISENIGTVNDRFRQAAVYQAAQVAIAEIVSPNSVNWNAIGDNHTTGNVKTLAQALIAAAKGQSGYFAAYSGYSIVYLQSSDPSTQNLVTPGSEVVKLTVKNSKTPPPPPPPSEEKVKGKVVIKKLDGDNKFLAGAKFQILDANGNVVKTFTSNGKVQEFVLEVGKYTLKEIEAPEGYVIEGNGEYPFEITADQLPMTQYVKIWNGGHDSGAANGGYKVAAADTDDWYPVFCLNVSMPNLNAGGANNSELPARVGNISRDQMLRILYVGMVGDAKGYSAQIEAGNGLDKATQWWQTTQYAINYYTNGQTVAYNKHGHYLTQNNMRIANELIAAANDTSITIPEGTVARLYQHSPKNGVVQQPMVSASFPKTVEITAVNKKKPKNPKIGTTASDSETGKIANADGSVTIVDTVAYKDLEKGKEYTLKGQLVRKSDKSVVATAEQKFTPQAENGTVAVTFTFDGSALAGDSVVAYEELYLGSTFVTEHKDINDEGQTVDFPSAKTTATEGGDHYAVPSGEVTIVDTVEYTNLIVGNTYTVTGELHVKNADGTDGGVLEVDGKPVVATKTFTAATRSGSVSLEFTFNASALQEQAVVAFETVRYKDKTVAVHTDIKDEEQTVYFPEIGTTATADGYKQVKADGTVTIKDVVSYEGLKPNTEYALSGKLVTKSSNGKDVVATKSTTFTASKTGKGEVTLEFTVDASTLAGDSVVAFETVSYNGKAVAVHADINDAGQTVTFPEVKTNATDKEDGNQLLAPEETVTVVDTVTYKNLIPNKEYTVSGVLMDKATNKPLVVDGKQVTAEKTFTPENKNGSVKLEFTFNASALNGKTLVVFETVKHEGREVAVHADINDENQTVRVAKIGTTATADGEKTIVLKYNENKNVTITDVIEYEGLKAGTEYTVTGTLHIRGDENADLGELTVDGKPVTVTKTFTADKNGKGTWTVEFTLNTADLPNDLYELVVFESVSLNGEEVVSHADITDEGQTVQINRTYPQPQIGTTATDADDNDKVLEIGSDATVKDVVAYEGLTVGRTYTLKGKLVVKATEGQEIVAESETTFTAQEETGTVDMFFKFNTTGLDGKDLVVYEYLYRGNLLGQDVSVDDAEATHADDNDAGQTVTVKKKVTPPPTPPSREGEKPRLPRTGLPKTGGDVGMAVLAALLLISGGLMLARRRNS